MKSHFYSARLGNESIVQIMVFFKTLKFTFLVLILFFSFAPKVIFSQGFCGFDNQGLTQNFINSYQSLIQQEIETQNLPPEAVTIPVIFHILHNGEPVGNGNNISQSVVNNAYNILNLDFGGTGIQFCLAQRSPEGEILSEPGIKRVNGTSAGYSGSISLGGADEALVKGLSYFTNHRYINIWVVGSIGGGVAGYATFPNTVSNTLDGIVMSKVYLGGNYHILTHEMGHFFSLLHTFHGDDYNGNGVFEPNIDGCPNNNPYFQTGDGVSDTQPHTRSPNNTCLSGSNPCSSLELLENITNNHMDYSDESCRMVFTGKQIERMNCALNMSRQGLKSSLGCSAGCNTPFSISLEQEPMNPVLINDEIVFAVSMPPNVTYSDEEWYVEGILQPTQTPQVPFSFLYTFTIPKIYNICYRVNNGSCIMEKCIEVNVVSSSACQTSDPGQCELLLNGDFSQYDGQFEDCCMTGTTEPLGTLDYYPAVGFQSEKVCNWMRIKGTPSMFLISAYGNNTNSNIMTLQNGNDYQIHDILCTQNELNLIDGVYYTLSFDYGASISSPGFSLELRNSLTSTQSHTLFSSGNIIGSLTISIPYHEELTFQYKSSYGKYLFLYAEPGNGVSNVKISNISIRHCCIPKPEIEVNSIDKCRYQFNFGNSGDPASLYWEIESGPSGTAASTEFTFALPGTYQVCLYATCDDGQVNKEKCVTVTVDSGCTPNCGGIFAPLVNVTKWCDEDTYQGNVSIPIDPGFKPCNKDYLYFTPNDNIAYYDFYFDQSGATNYLNLSITFNSMPNNYYSLVLCGADSTSRCFQFGLDDTPIECNKCSEIEEIQIAECIDPNDMDNIFVYGGTINVTPEDGYLPCGSISTSGGYNQGNPVQEDDGSYSIPYTITTNQYGNFNSQLTLCFTDGGSETQCIKVNISIVDHCILDPSACLYDSEHTLYCTEVGADDAVFIFDHRFIAPLIFGEGYRLCDGGISLNNGTFEEIEVYDAERYLHTTLKLTIPCEVIDAEGNIELTLNLCDDANNEFCLLVLLNLDCPGCPSNKTQNRNKHTTYKFYPNPTNSILLVDAPHSTFNQQIFLYDALGKLVHQQPIQSGQSTIDLSFLHAGIYTTKIENGGDVFIQKVILIK